jgi:hypothetical protein
VEEVQGWPPVVEVARTTLTEEEYVQWLGIGELGEGLASGLSPHRADRLRYTDFETGSFNDAPEALAARATGAFMAAGWRQEANGAWVSAERACAGAAVDQSDSGVGTRAGPNVATSSDYLAFADLVVGARVEALFGGEYHPVRVKELGDGWARHNASDGTDGWVTAGASHHHRFTGLLLTIYRHWGHRLRATRWSADVVS